MLKRRTPDESGAAAVETALLLPLLLALVFGAAEVAWSVDQRQSNRFQAHEISRLASLDFGGLGDTDEEIAALLCDRSEMDDSAQLSVTLPDGNEKGDTVEVVLMQPVDEITGMLSTFFADKTAQNTARATLETDVTFSDFSHTCGAARLAVAIS